MKNRSLSFWLLCGVAAVALGAAAPQYITTRDLNVRNATDTVGLTIRKTGTLTSNLVEAFNPSGTLKFALPATGVLPIAYGGTASATAAAAKTAFGIQSGSVTTSSDNTVTNTFATMFSSAPVVVIAQTGDACTVTNSLTITKSNFVYGAGSPAIVAKWIAVGAP